MNKNEIRKNLIDINKTMGWLAEELNISRRTLYRKLDKNDDDTIVKIKNILSDYRIK
ncbi:helix-turn-helix domain-containing protein [Fusobacterium ulcerans]|uniref:helix-turn-helix domain-containing protein n=1 Tax=Fusobacterium ulcerans TaxID=861 RepID=UPI0026ED392E|nr:helix-turn-helix domain-containing protein [Fusobacterium ulcerans]